jgi:hypothetical protein
MQTHRGEPTPYQGAGPCRRAHNASGGGGAMGWCGAGGFCGAVGAVRQGARQEGHDPRRGGSRSGPAGLLSWAQQRFSCPEPERREGGGLGVHRGCGQAQAAARGRRASAGRGRCSARGPAPRGRRAARAVGRAAAAAGHCRAAPAPSRPFGWRSGSAQPAPGPRSVRAHGDRGAARCAGRGAGGVVARLGRAVGARRGHGRRVGLLEQHKVGGAQVDLLQGGWEGGARRAGWGRVGQGVSGLQFAR